MRTKEWIQDLICTKRSKLCLYFVGIDHRVRSGTAGYYPAFSPGAWSLPSGLRCLWVVHQATYIYCYAHRLNLFVVDVVEIMVEFVTFRYLQQFHNFLSTSIVHSRYVAIQNELHLEHQMREIMRIFETRLPCQCRAWFTLFVTLKAVSDIIGDLAEEIGARGTAAHNLQ